MLDITRFDQIYIYRPFADFRKGINGLCGIIQDEMNLNPFKKYLFIFCSRTRDKVKMIYWDDTGFVLWHKRLEVEKYLWPTTWENDSIKVDVNKIQAFLQGLDPWREPHKNLDYSSI